MPTYEYACDQCGKHIDVFQSFSDDPLTTCEVCGGTLRKVFGNVGIVFKGSGFYKNDSRGSSSSSSSSTPAASITSNDSTPPAATPAPASTSTSSDSAS
jgi:putative FmdB family regulatory protein